MDAEAQAQADRLLEAQPDYIKDLHRRLQMECRRAGVGALGGAGALGAGPPTDTLGLGLGAEAAAPQGLRREVPAGWPREGSPDEGAGGCRVRRFDRPVAQLASPAAATVPRAPVVPPLAAKPSATDVGGFAATPRNGAAAVAKEVLRLRLARRQHEDLRARLSKTESQLKRLPPTAISQFLGYLEKHLGDPELAVHVQEAVANLIECLCAVCRVELASAAPEGLLGGARRLLRDPHGFAKRLCAMPPRSSTEAEGLAPFLLSEVQYRKVREKEVNAVYEALHSWLTAFYFFSAVSDQVSSTEKELERQEGLLRRLEGGGQEDPPVSGRASPAVSPRSRPRAGFQPAVGARGSAAPGGAAAPGGSPGPLHRSFGARGAQSPVAARRSARSSMGDFAAQTAAMRSGGGSGSGGGGMAAAAAAAVAAAAAPAAAPLPRMQSLQSDALLTYLRAKKKEGGPPPPPGSGYAQQTVAPEQLQQEARFQGGIHRRSSAPTFMGMDSARLWQD